MLRSLIAKLRAWWRREAVEDANISRETLESRRVTDTEYTELGGKL
jgi:hypothetical protein